MTPHPLRFWAQAAGASQPSIKALGRLLDASVHQLSSDSRTVVAGQLFVALRGEHFDGHRFVTAALARGAVAAVVDQEGVRAHSLDKARCIVVPDTLAALGAMARAYRLTCNAKVVAITGSNGKTTTKELMAAALSGHGGVHKTEGNLNNLVGVPQTLLGMPSDTAAAVIEMGMNAPTEIARLTHMAVPHVGIITSVAPAHLLGLGTIEQVARAKCELIEAMPADGVVVLNADDKALMAAALPLVGRRRVVRFGTQQGVDVQLVAAISHASSKKSSLRGPRTAMTLEVEGQRFIGTLPLLGQHNARNAAAAVAAAWALGRAPAESLAHFEHVSVPGARLRLLEVVEAGLWLLDDAYNANPGSVKAALDTLGDIAARHRRIAVLGDMLELGPTSNALHHDVGAYAAKSGVGVLLCVGEFAAATARGAREAGLSHAFDVPHIDALWPLLAQNLTPGDWVLIKGSRGARLERVTDALMAGQVLSNHGVAIAHGKTRPNVVRPSTPSTSR